MEIPAPESACLVRIALEWVIVNLSDAQNIASDAELSSFLFSDGYTADGCVQREIDNAVCIHEPCCCIQNAEQGFRV
jgi:hypothetical protein